MVSFFPRGSIIEREIIFEMISEHGLARDRPGDLRIRELDNPRTQWPEDSKLKVARIFQGLKNLFHIERYK